MCHTNGSAPHLTKFGYMYRRAGYRFIDRIGDKEADDQAMRLSEHFAVGTNLSYEIGTTQTPSAASSTLTSNQFNVPEVELWPIVGSFLGNFAAWTEIDANVNTATTPGKRSGGINLTQADLRYVTGNKDFFINTRGGILNSEGYGASDQWVDDSNLPLFDRITAQFNQDTLVLPLGANNVPQLGAEFGLNYQDSHLTLGIYNGFDGTNGVGTSAQSTLAAALMNQPGQNSKDYKVQLDQFVGQAVALTGIFYHGQIPLLDPSNSLVWLDQFSALRLYATWAALPNTVDILAGGAYGNHGYVNSGTTQIVGTFPTRGAFVGANYYVMPHLTLSGRVDYNQINYSTTQPLKADGFALIASLPYENNMFIFHYNTIWSDVAGTIGDFRAEWRFLL